MERDWFSIMPKDILCIILHFLPSCRELVTMACVSKKFDEIINMDETFWKEKCIDWWSERPDFSDLEGWFAFLMIELLPNISKLPCNPQREYFLRFNWRW